MDFTQLKTHIIITNNRLELAINDLASSDLSQLFVPYLKDGKLVIENITQHTETDTDITVVGTGSQPPFAGMQVTAVFSIQEANPAIVVTATADSNWTLAQEYPSLQHTLVESIHYNTPTLILSSYDVSAQIKRGMTFHATLHNNSIFGILELLFPKVEHRLYGEITMTPSIPEVSADIEPVPNMFIEGPDGITTDLTLFQLTDIRYELCIDPRFNYDKVEWDNIVYLAFSANVPFQAQGTQHSIFLSAQLFNPQSDVRLSADLSDLGNVALEELGSLVNHTGLTTPFDFNIKQLVRFANLDIVINPTGSPKIRYVNLKLETQESWTIVEDLLTLEAIDVSFRVDDPLGGRNLSGSVSGLVGIGESGTLELSAFFGNNFSETSIGGGLRRGDPPLNIREVYEHFTKKTNPHLPDLVVTAFDFFMELPTKQRSATYQGELILDGEWVILEESPQLLLYDIQFSLAHPDAQRTHFTARVSFLIEQVLIGLTAQYQDEQKGWEFSGETGKGQAIPIGNLIANLGQRFRPVVLPKAIADLTIENLATSFNTGAKDFTFTCESQFPIDHQNIDITVNINILRQLDLSYKKHFDGHITIGSLKFALIFDTDQTSTKFLAAYHDDQTVKVKDLIGYIDSQLKKDIPEGLEISLKDALFVYAKQVQGQATITNFLFGLNMGGGINLSNLPLVGREFPPNETLKISLQVLVTKANFTATELQTFNTLYPDGGIKLPTTDVNQRLDLTPSIQLGSEIQQLQLPIAINKNTGQIQDTGSSSNNTNSVVTPSATPTPIDDGTKWFQLQKSLGPVHFQRIGLKYQDSKIWVLLDASLNLAGLSLSLDGLAVNSPLNQFDPKFDLKGIGIDYKGGDTLEIGGAFLRTQVTKDGKTYDEYDGAAVIKFKAKGKDLTLSAIGSYAYVDGHPSLFIYALLDYPIGGPSFFFVTGLAAGFGYNRALKVPTIDQVATFPLVAEAVNPPPAAGSNLDKAARLTGELTKLRDYIPPETGQIFLAIGVKFNSFKTIDAFVLLTVAFGNRFELNILGLATLIAPANVGADVTPVAEVQLALKASFLPAEGFLGIIAQLTPNSYILSKACHLTGGFAFYTWFAPNEHDGDFVLTLGGYHPLFKVPDHYPKVPRLGLNWQVSPELFLKADAYFALTPSAIMAGGHLQATWNSGPLSAWFNAGADFLMSWKPYHYDISIYIDMGVSYTFHFFGTHHITVQLGADLYIWGPEFTGIAHIHLWIISFDVRFGSSASQAPTAIDWNEFKTSFLPAADAICSITVQEGLVRKVNQDDKTDLGIINPKDFCLVTNSVIPAKKAVYTKDITLQDDQIQIAESNTQFGISPMEVKSEQLTSDLTISITRDGKSLSSEEFDKDFTCIPLFKKVPIALWGESLTPSLNGNQFIENTLSGLEIKPKKQPEPGATQAINRRELQFSTTQINNACHWQTIGTFHEETTKDISSTIIDNAVNNTRENLLKALNLNSEEIDLSATIANNLLGSPKIGVLVN